MDFDWRTTRDLDIRNRYPTKDENIRWIDSWMKLIQDLEAAQGQDPEHLFQASDSFFSALPRGPVHHPVPRVFVSHRKSDHVLAEQVALHVTLAGLEYWLDVHNPNLRLVNKAVGPGPVRSLLTAAIIEIGLLNCSHVIALHTSNSSGSKWIPYELGRVKERHVLSECAGGWFEKGLPRQAYGAYCDLNKQVRTGSELDKWMTTEARKLGVRGPGVWRGRKPPPPRL